jgi:hypothetical protein
MRLQDRSSRLSSVFFSLQRVPTEPAFLSKGSRPLAHPASAFDCALAVLSGHSSSQAADVIRACDRGWGTFDHASSASFSMTFRYRSRHDF